MEMLRSSRGDKHEFCLVIKFNYVRSCQSFDRYFIRGAVICSCKSSANEWSMTECELIMASKGMAYVVERIGPRTEP